jgi:O-acetyl-ADP-ribose deacetylase (regulator of RNase III)
MERRFGNAVVKLVRGDITVVAVDAIVNAANSSLVGGGGVDGAIHSAGGPAIIDECREIVGRIGRLETGKAVLTTAGNMPATYVIHTVGPVWHGGGRGEPELLADAYRNSLSLAEEKGIRSIAFSSISTGVYGYPMEKAARLAREVIAEFLKGGTGIEEVQVVLFSNEAYNTWKSVFVN